MTETSDLDLLEEQFTEEPDIDPDRDADSDDNGSPVFYMRWNRGLVRIDIDEFTALDFGRFRQTTGLNLIDLQTGSLECFAGALWLILRRDNKKLRYQDVAKRVRWSHIVDEDTGRSELGGDDPEA